MNGELKLSAAIRLGAMLKPQAFRATQDGSCALWAAADAVGIGCSPRAERHPDYGALKSRFPVLRLDAECPDCKFRHAAHWSLLDVVWHLNDVHRWTREQIADYVSTFEPQDMLPELAEGSVAVEVGR